MARRKPRDARPDRHKRGASVVAYMAKLAGGRISDVPRQRADLHDRRGSKGSLAVLSGASMSRALLVLSSREIRERGINWIRRAPADTRVTFQAPKRSLDQNSKLWACLT